MSKQPSAETQLRQLKSDYNRMREKATEALQDVEFLRSELKDVRAQLLKCEAERSKLLDAMCAHAKREPTPINVTNNTVTPEPKQLVSWVCGPQKILAIKWLRETSDLGLADAKHVIEQGCGALTAKQQQAIAPYVTFAVGAAQ